MPQGQVQGQCLPGSLPWFVPLSIIAPSSAVMGH